MIVGPLATAPIYSETKNGNPIVTVVINVDTGYTTKDGSKTERIEPVAVKLFGGIAHAANEMDLHVGDAVAIAFSLSGREYNDKYYTDVVGRDISIVSREAADIPDTNKTNRTAKQPIPELGDQNDDDLPF